MRDTHNDFWADMLPQSGTVATQSLIEAEIRAVFAKAGLKPTEIKRVSKALFVNDSRRTTTTETAEPTKAQSTEPHLCPNAASPWLPPILDTTSNSYPSTRLKASTPLSCTTSFGAPSSPTGYTRAEWAAASAPNSLTASTWTAAACRSVAYTLRTLARQYDAKLMTVTHSLAREPPTKAMPRSASVTCSATWAITRIATTPLPRVAQATHVLHKPIFSSALVNKSTRVAPPHPGYLDDASASHTGTAQNSETPPELPPSLRAPKHNPGAWIRNLLEDGDVESHPGPARFVSKNVN